jgi:hypothetical protein
MVDKSFFFSGLKIIELCLEDTDATPLQGVMIHQIYTLGLRSRLLEPPESFSMVYTGYKPGIYFCKEYIWYLPGIFQEYVSQIKSRFYQFESVYAFSVYFNIHNGSFSIWEL